MYVQFNFTTALCFCWLTLNSWDFGERHRHLWNKRKYWILISNLNQKALLLPMICIPYLDSKLKKYSAQTKFSDCKDWEERKEKIQTGTGETGYSVECTCIYTSKITPSIHNSISSTCLIALIHTTFLPSLLMLHDFVLFLLSKLCKSHNRDYVSH